MSARAGDDAAALAALAARVAGKPEGWVPSILLRLTGEEYLALLGQLRPGESNRQGVLRLFRRACGLADPPVPVPGRQKGWRKRPAEAAEIPQAEIPGPPCADTGPGPAAA